MVRGHGVHWAGHQPFKIDPYPLFIYVDICMHYGQHDPLKGQ